MAKKPLRIAEVAPLWENIPPKKYGGTERVVFNLTEELVKMGHRVSLFAPGTAKTSAKLVSVVERSLIDSGVSWDNMLYPLLNITEVFDRQKEFDIIHIHLNKSSDYIALPLARFFKHKVVFTLHFPYPTTEERKDRHIVLQKYKELNYVSISNSQRKGGENLHWVGTVYNGIDAENYTFNPSPKNYFAWIGRFNPYKGAREAILAAKKAKVNLIIAGRLDQKHNPDDYRYYEKRVKRLVDDKQIIHIKELDERQKIKLLGDALGFLNPIQWNEPFGLVMAEAMAVGTPVISFPQGAAPELVKEGKTGFLVNTVDQMAKKIQQIKKIDRTDCRKRVDQHFSKKVMAESYVSVFKKLLRKA